jgi:hypothetical protein
LEGVVDGRSDRDSVISDFEISEIRARCRSQGATVVDELKSKQEDASSSFPSQRVTTHTMDASSQGGLNEEEATSYWLK